MASLSLYLPANKLQMAGQEASPVFLGAIKLYGVNITLMVIYQNMCFDFD